MEDKPVKKLKEREFRLWILLTLVILIAWIVTVGMFHENFIMKENTFLETELQRFEGEVNSTLVTYEEFANYIFDEINQDDEIPFIISQANTVSEIEKEVLREKLHQKVADKYPIMQKYKFRQFHFHLPTTESFLRVHIPEKYGDLLIDSRESVRLVNQTQMKISGFEEGKIFNGFRNVYPIEYENQHVGSVEISMSSASIIEILSELHAKRDYYFVIDKDVVEENLFEDQLENYRASNILLDYYVDIEADEVTAINNLLIKNTEKLFFESMEEKYKERFEAKESFTIVHRFKDKDYIVNFLGIKNFKNSPTAYLISISPYVGGYGKFMQDMYWEIILVTFLAFFIIAFGLVLAFYQNNLKDSAELDYLTNIYNRKKFYEITKQEIKTAKRYGQEMAVIFMDIDHFKKLNDTYGHAWGDKVLQELANQVLIKIRTVDVFARWGGEEFVLLLPNTGKKGAIIVAEKIRKLIDDSESEVLKDVTISVGVSVLDTKTYDIDTAISCADAAMYVAKQKGRNQVRYK